MRGTGERKMVVAGELPRGDVGSGERSVSRALRAVHNVCGLRGEGEVGPGWGWSWLQVPGDGRPSRLWWRI